MKVEFKNLGPIKKATLDIRPLTVVIGPNNTGKTHLAHTVYWAHKRFAQFGAAQLAPTDPRAARVPHSVANVGELWRSCWQEAAQRTGTELSTAVPLVPFANTETLVAWSAEWAKEAEAHAARKGLKQMATRIAAAYTHRQELAQVGLGEVLALVAERTSLLDFWPLYNAATSRFAENHGAGVDDDSGLKPMLGSPLSALFGVLNDVAYDDGDDGSAPAPNSFRALAETLVAAMQAGDRVVMDSAGPVPKPMLQMASGATMPIEHAAAATKQLVALVWWLGSRAHTGAVVVIDEPELNLHPENQARLTEGLAILVNLGVRVFVTTHSTYVVDHLNNLMAMDALTAKQRERIVPKLKLQDERAILDPGSVAVYETTTRGTVKDIVDRKRTIIDWQTFGAVSDYVTNLYGEMLEAK